MSPTTEQLRARMAAELDELGPMPDLSTRAAREGGRILRRRRIAAGSLLGVAGVGGCSLLGAVAAGALPGSGGRVADHPTPRPVPSPDVVPPVPPVPSAVPSPRMPPTLPALPLPSLPAATIPEPSPRPGATAVPPPVPAVPAPSPRPDTTAPAPPALPDLPAPTPAPTPTPR